MEKYELLFTKVHFLYYEDYSRDMNQTVTKLADFLEYQPLAHGPLPFSLGKTYGHLYSDAFKHKVAHLVRKIASPECWKLLQHYFDGMMMTNGESKASGTDSKIPMVAEDEPWTHRIIWLLSFPQSVRLDLSNLMTHPLSQTSSPFSLFAA